MIHQYVSPKMIAAWKQEYWAIFKVNVGDVEFIYRQLSRKEHKLITTTYETTDEQEDAVCSTCVLWPKEFNFSTGPAGIPFNLSTYILDSSGFTLESRDLVAESMDIFRKEMTTLENQLACIIVEAFPKFTVEEIDGWPITKSLWYLSRAEYTINILRSMIMRGEQISYASYEENESESEEYYEESIPMERVPDQRQLQRSKIIDDPSFDMDLLNPDIAKRKKTEVNGSKSDFPELSEVERFMQGKLF